MSCVRAQWLSSAGIDRTGIAWEMGLFNEESQVVLEKYEWLEFCASWEDHNKYLRRENQREPKSVWTRILRILQFEDLVDFLD